MPGASAAKPAMANAPRSVLPEHAAVRELLRGRLAEVLAEQQSRTKIATAR